MSDVEGVTKTYETDSRGFLRDFSSWDEAFAVALAPRLGIERGLTEDHPHGVRIQSGP